MDNNKQLTSIWGKWWIPIRIWFYPLWLIYETLTRFYDYTQSVHHYFIQKQDYLVTYLGKTGTLALDAFSSIFTFIICTVSLTVPACFILYKFLTMENLTGTLFEKRMKHLL